MYKHLIESFKIEESVNKIQSIGYGHINDTYTVTLEGHNSPSYILQRINHNIFPNIEKLSENIFRATNHLKQNGNCEYQVMSLIKAKDEKLWHQSDDGNFWRLFTHIPDSYSFNLASSNNFATEASKAYGWFLKTLSNLNEPPLYEVIPGFHNLGLRISQLESAINDNKADRVKSCKNVIDFFLSRSNEMLEFDSLIGTPEIPIRVTHNDTKINNVLFNSNGKAISVVDLDTVMPGVVHYDFGDAIRTIAATALEDETKLELVGINTELYKAFAAGYLSETDSLLTTKEKYYLPHAPRMMAYIMAIRFLADYLWGDAYYKVKHSEHNIQRAINQMVLIIDMEKKSNEMNL